MPIISYKIDKYIVRIYANDLRGNLTRWATKEIYLYSGGQEVATAYFAAGALSAPDATIQNGYINFHAPAEQYAPVIDLLRNEKPVYIAWEPRSDDTEANDGDAYFLTEQEPVGEGEPKTIRLA